MDVYGAETLGVAFTLTLLAGLATAVGGLTVLLTTRTNTRFLAACLSFSAGVMLYVSFVEILPESVEFLSVDMGHRPGMWGMLGGFFGGVVVVAVADRLAPALLRSRKGRAPTGPSPALHDRALLHMGILTAAAIALHNFPEGFATFMAALADPAVAAPLATAIAIHNVPEGIAVAVPVYQATGSRWKAVGLAFLSGIAEPVGAVLGFAVLAPWLTDTVFGVVFAAVAGVMVFISLDKLLPSAQKYGGQNLSLCGVIAGMAVMGISLTLLA